MDVLVALDYPACEYAVQEGSEVAALSRTILSRALIVSKQHNRQDRN
jgi:hypothetical protein